jgi:integrase/recombinase XerD
MDLSILFDKEGLKNYESHVPLGMTPLWNYWNEFVLHYLREGKSEVTIKSVRDVLRFFVRQLKILTIEDCNNPDILREALFKAKEERNWSNNTLNTYRKNVNTYFLWLLDMEYIEENKIKKVRKCKEVQNEQLTLTEEQVSTVRKRIADRRQTRLERWRNILFFDILILTGARPCELEAMQIRDIQDEGNGYKIVIQGRKQKGRKRFYTLPSSIRDTYEMYISVRQDLGREESCLFSSQSKRTGFGYKGISKLLQKLSEEVGFRITAYSIRRFVATRLYLNNVSLKDTQQHLGHTRPSTTMRYIEHTCALTDRGVEVMGEMF